MNSKQTRLQKHSAANRGKAVAIEGSIYRMQRVPTVEGQTGSGKQPEVVVLASGGIDSSTLLAMYKALGRPTSALFVDYGQPAVVQETEAVQSVTHFLDVPLMMCRWSGAVEKSAGLIMGRNAFLLSAALMESPSSTSAIAIGVHAGTPYSDCAPPFILAMRSVWTSYQSRIEIAVPFISWSKGEIASYARELGIPIDLTYSCECGGANPCRVCASCRDREALHACA